MITGRVANPMSTSSKRGPQSESAEEPCNAGERSFMSSVLYGQHFHTARLIVDAAPADLGVVAVQQPELRDERGFDFAAVEDADDAAFGDDDGDGAQALRNRRSREVATPQPQRQIDPLYRCVQIPTRGDDGSRFGDNKRTIELRQLLNRAAEVWIADMCSSGCVPK